MGNGRVRDDGHVTLSIRIAAVRFTCGEGHEWELDRATIVAAPDDAERCTLCMGPAVDATIADQSRTVERRGVVIDATFPRDAPGGG